MANNNPGVDAALEYVLSEAERKDAAKQREHTRRKQGLPAACKTATPKKDAPVEGNMRVRTVEVDVDNPYHDPDPQHAGKAGNPSVVRARVNMMESPAAFMFYNRKTLSVAQHEAAKEFRRIWELAGGTGASAMDYTREAVDGGGASEPISVRRGDAVFRLKELRDLLGEGPYSLIEKTCGECLFIKDMVKGSRARKRATDAMKDSLTVLAVEFGYQRGSQAA